MRAIGFAVLLLLGGCGLNDHQKDEVSDIASAEAYDAISEADRINDLENRIDDLEARLDNRGIE